MDGFHLDNAELDAMGLRHLNGAPQTFDVAGFVKLVRAVRAQADTLRYPLLDRAQDKTLPDAGQLDRDVPIIVFEGNYLLLRDPSWSDLRDRLIAGWLAYRLTHDQAVARAEGNDIPNARLVIANSAPADLTLASVSLAEIQER